MPFPMMGLNMSPVLATRSMAFLIVKSDILNPVFTSSQCSGIETVAPA
jgi:hypothetical protein